MLLKSQLVSAIFGIVLALSVSTSAQAQLKVGFVYVGPIGDHGWTYEHNQGRLAIAKALGLKTTYVEKVPEGADAQRVIAKLRSNGQIIVYFGGFF